MNRKEKNLWMRNGRPTTVKSMMKLILLVIIIYLGKSVLFIVQGPSPFRRTFLASLCRAQLGSGKSWADIPVGSEHSLCSPQKRHRGFAPHLTTITLSGGIWLLFLLNAKLHNSGNILWTRPLTVCSLTHRGLTGVNCINDRGLINAENQLKRDVSPTNKPHNVSHNLCISLALICYHRMSLFPSARPSLMKAE